MAQEGKEDKSEMTSAEEYSEEEKLLEDKLADNNFWSSSERKEELLSCLEVVSALRASKTACVLAGRIGYRPYPEREDLSIAPEIAYPVYRALKRIGLPSIPHMIAELKKTNFEIDEKSHIKHSLLVLCMWEIYDQGGHGKTLLKIRLELELAAIENEQEKANIRAALGKSIFGEGEDSQTKD